MKKIIYIIVLASLLGSCKKAFEPKIYSKGELDFSNYIAVGNSLTQGYQDGGLHEATQINSYPAIIARQMKKVQPDMPDFIQPLATGTGSGYIHLEYRNNQITVVKPKDEGGIAEDASFNTLIRNKKYNNLGISGIKLINVVSDDNISGDKLFNYLVMRNNPFGNRFLDFGFSNAPIEYLQYVANSKPSFFTCWLGNNDMLSFATSGGVPGELELSGTKFYLNGISNILEFRKKYNQALDSLMKNGAKGVVATLPNVTSIPFFSVVKQENIKGADGLPLTIYYKDENDLIITVKKGDILLLPVASTIMKFEKDSTDLNGDLVRDSDGNGLKTYSSSPHGLDPNNPLNDDEVLDVAEFSQLQSAVLLLNNEIKTAAASHNIPVVDMFEFLQKFETGIEFNGIELTTKYIEGGVFSLDGVHPSPRGYAVVANKFIEVINNNYNSSIPKVNITNYPGVTFP